MQKDFGDFNVFKFGPQELKSVALAEMLMVLHDIENTSEIKKVPLRKKYYNPKKIKTEWLRTWVQIISRSSFPTENFDANEIEKLLREIHLTEEQRFIALIECSAFPPYVPIPRHEIDYLKRVKAESKSWKEAMLMRADAYKIEEHFALDIRDHIKRALWGMGGGWKRIAQKALLVMLLGLATAVTAGIFAPATGTLIGVLTGLSGAAATAHGLALLGGGALAAGGWGMAGGTAVLVGGGALLGVGGGVLSSAVFSLSREKAVLDSAKLETFLSVFLLRYKKDNKRAKSMYAKLRETIFSMRKLRDDIELRNESDDIRQLKEKGNDDTNITKIRQQLDKAMPVYEELLDRLREKIGKAV